MDEICLGDNLIGGMCLPWWRVGRGGGTMDEVMSRPDLLI